MNEKCEILETNWDKGQVLAGTITLKNGKLTSHAEKGYSILMNNVMKDSKGVDPKKWFKGLPKFYDGVALRARMKGKSGDE